MAWRVPAAAPDSYRLRIDPVRSTPIQVNQTLAGNLAASGMFDYFTVSLQADTGYRIEILLDSMDDSVLTLFDPDGREVASNDNRSNESYASFVEYTAATSGTYTIGVTGSNSSTGSYRLRIDAVRSTPIRVGQPLAARFPARSASDYFTVFLQADTHYRVEVLLDSMDVSMWTLFDPDGREVASNNDFSGNGFSDESYASRSDYIATTSGTYTIGVAGFRQRHGCLSVEDRPGPFHTHAGGPNARGQSGLQKPHSTTSRCPLRPTRTIGSKSCWIRWTIPS